MRMEHAQVVQHSMVIQYTCPENDLYHSIEIKNPSIQEGQYFSDWTYKYVEFKCDLCSKTHKFEI